MSSLHCNAALDCHWVGKPERNLASLQLVWVSFFFFFHFSPVFSVLALF